MLSLSVLLGVVGCQSSSSTSEAPASLHKTDLARYENGRAVSLIDAGKYTEAEPLILKAISADDQFAPAHNNLGLVYFHSNRLYQAAWEFETAIKLMPNSPEPLNNLGLVLEQAGKQDEAVSSYEKARALQPDNPEYLGNLARARVERGNKDSQTRALLQEIIQKDFRADWRYWARVTLFRLRPEETTQPAIEPPPSK